MTSWSLKALHTHSGNSAVRKFPTTRNDWALVGTRTRNVSMTGSRAVVSVIAGQPGAVGMLPAFAASQSAGTAELVPMLFPGSKATKPGLDGEAALPVDRTT